MIYIVNILFWYFIWSLSKLQNAYPKGITVPKCLFENLKAKFSRLEGGSKSKFAPIPQRFLKRCHRLSQL